MRPLSGRVKEELKLYSGSFGPAAFTFIAFAMEPYGRLCPAAEAAAAEGAGASRRGREGRVRAATGGQVPVLLPAKAGSGVGTGAVMADGGDGAGMLLCGSGARRGMNRKK
ncbi:unnamed protein product [Phaeothamnion confervicola]